MRRQNQEERHEPADDAPGVHRLTGVAGVTQQIAVTATGAAPPDGYQSWDEYTDEFADTYAFIADADYRRGMKALRLAPTLEVYRALMEGQQVPREALNPVWVRRYRL